MPNFEITPQDYVDECDSYEIADLLKILEREGYINLNIKNEFEESLSGSGINLQEYFEAIKKLSNLYYRLSIEDTELIKKIANKY